MQEKMAEMQAQLETVEMTGVAGGGMVQVTLERQGRSKKIKIDKSLLDPDEVEVLEDLIVAAFNDAKAQGCRHAEEEMQKLTGGLQLPRRYEAAVLIDCGCTAAPRLSTRCPNSTPDPAARQIARASGRARRGARRAPAQAAREPARAARRGARPRRPRRFGPARSAAISTPSSPARSAATRGATRA